MLINKANSTAETPSAADTAKKIKRLLKPAREERADAIRLDDLRQLFAQLVADGELEFGVEQTGRTVVAAKWRSYLKKSHKTMVSQLCERIGNRKRTALRCMYGVIASSPMHSNNGKHHYINDELLKRCVHAIVMMDGELDKSLRNMLDGEFLRPYRDVQYYVLGALAELASSLHKADDDEVDDLEEVSSKMLQLLMMIPLPKTKDDLKNSQHMFPPSQQAPPSRSSAAHSDDDDEDDYTGKNTDDEYDSDDNDNGASNVRRKSSSSNKRPNKKRKLQSGNGSKKRFSFEQLGSFQAEYQKAWLAIMKLPFRSTDLKTILQFLPTEVLPNVPEPLKFSDFFINAYADHDTGVIGVLSLEGIFFLITQQGLEFADFYKQLYQLVTPRVMYAKYRVRFFEFLTKCLARNQMLPAHIIAAFCKRICRCALNAPPSAILFCLGLVSNLIRLHPECACLINRQGGDEVNDEFNAGEDDPVKCNALRSCLWELCVLEKHYIPAIQTLAKGLGSVEESKMPLHMMEDFIDHSYKSLFDYEKKKRAKTALAFTKPTGLFTADDIFSNVLDTN